MFLKSHIENFVTHSKNFDNNIFDIISNNIDYDLFNYDKVSKNLNNLHNEVFIQPIIFNKIKENIITQVQKINELEKGDITTFDDNFTNIMIMKIDESLNLQKNTDSNTLIKLYNIFKNVSHETFINMFRFLNNENYKPSDKYNINISFNELLQIYKKKLNIEITDDDAIKVGVLGKLNN